MAFWTKFINYKAERPAENNGVSVFEQGAGGVIAESGIFKAYVPDFLYKPPYGYPRKENLPEMKALAKNAYVFSVIKTLCDEAVCVPWKVQVKKEFNDDGAENYDEKIKEASKFIRNPNGNEESFEHILRQVITGICEVDAGLLVKVFGVDGKLKQMFARDGATFLKNPDIYGYIGNRAEYVAPLPTGFENISVNFDNLTQQQLAVVKQYDMLYREQAAYFQYGWTAGSMPVPFGRREVIYMMQNPRPDSIYGRSPIEILSDIIKALVYGSEYNLDFYVNNNMPDGVIELLGASPQQIKQLRANMEDKFRFKDSLGVERKKFFKYPISSVPVDLKKFQFNPQEMDIIAQQEWFTKVLWMCFGVTADEMGFTENSNKAVSQQQTKLVVRKALKPLLQVVQYHLNTQLMPEFFAEKDGMIPDSGDVPIEFIFDDYDFDQDKQQHDILEQELRMGVKTPEMIAKELDIDIEELKQGKEEERQTMLADEEKRAGFAAKPAEQKAPAKKEEKSLKQDVNKKVDEIDNFVDGLGKAIELMIEKIPPDELQAR